MADELRPKSGIQPKYRAHGVVKVRIRTDGVHVEVERRQSRLKERLARRSGDASTSNPSIGPEFRSAVS